LRWCEGYVGKVVLFFEEGKDSDGDVVEEERAEEYE